MKLLILIGPDVLGVKYASKKSAYRALKRRSNAKIKRMDDCQIMFKKRRYCKAELDDAIVLTLSEFHKTMRV